MRADLEKRLRKLEAEGSAREPVRYRVTVRFVDKDEEADDPVTVRRAGGRGVITLGFD